MNKIKFSIIIPVYNVEKYLHRCLDSVRNQTYQNIEIILIDDGSTDHSGEICDEYKNKDQRIIVIHKENEGASIARNEGLKIASGDYILFVDSDDSVNQATFQTFSEIIEKRENLDIICGGANVLEKNKTSHFKFIKPLENNLMDGCEFLKLQLSNKNIIHQYSWLFLFNHNFLTRNELRFDKNHFGCEDKPFNTKALLNAKSVIISEFIHYNYYRRLGSLSILDSKKKVVSAIEMCADLEKEIDKLSDELLKKLLHNEILKRYIIALASGKICKKSDNPLIDKVIVKKKAVSLSNKIRVTCFRFCPPLYCFLYHLHTSLRNKRYKKVLFE